MATTFSAQHKTALQAHGVTDDQCQKLAAAGCDPAKCVAVMPQLKSAAEAAGFQWQQLLTFLLTNLPALLSLFGLTPAPAPTPGPTPAQK